MSQFDNCPNRVGTFSYKWARSPYKINPNVPAHKHWCADMDFRCPEPILAALREEIERGIMGYGCTPDDLMKIIADYLSKQDWEDITEEYLNKHLIFSPGVVAGIGLLLHVLTKEGDAIMFNTPSYPHFFDTVAENKRKVVNNKMKCVDGNGLSILKILKRKLLKNK